MAGEKIWQATTCRLPRPFRPRLRLGHGKAGRGYNGRVGAANSTKIKPPALVPRSSYDVRLLRDGLVLSLSRQPSLAVAGSADLTISPTHIAAARPDVVLLDVGAPGGPETLLVLRQALADMKIVAIAVSDIEQEVVACAEAGISGFVSRDGSI